MSQPLDNLPIWAVYPLTVLFLLAAIEARLPVRQGQGPEAAPGSDAGLGAISGATLGMLAFLLAFVIGFGMNLNADRRTLVLDEANAIRSTYLRAGYLVDPYRTESRDLLSEYLDQRLAAVEPGKLEQAKAPLGRATGRAMGDRRERRDQRGQVGHDQRIRRFAERR